jgi:aminocarboxymuconate-semialdehyde decarboxylase
MGIIIDGFSHILPKTFAEALYQAHPTDELRELASFDYFGDMENRVRVLDKFQIDKQILTVARPSIWLDLPQEIVMEMTRLANKAVAEMASRFPDRFLPVGTLPVPSEPYMEEFDRCIDDLDMVGIQIFANVEGKNLDEPQFRAFFEKANNTGTPVWLHPQLWKEHGCHDSPLFGKDQGFLRGKNFSAGQVCSPLRKSLGLFQAVLCGYRSEWICARV